MKNLFQGRPWLALLLIWVGATALNITKAVHMDDTIYLEIARWINVSPLHPFTGQVNWVNTLEPIYRISSSPLFFVYGLALVMKCFGESEIALHGLMALFTALSVVSFYGIASQLKLRQPLALTAMCVLGPAFVPSQNLMLDVPQLALSLFFFWALFATYNATPKRTAQLFALAGLAAGAASLTKYPGLVLLPILAIYLAMNRQWRYVWALVIPVAMLGAWCAFNIYDYGSVQTSHRDMGLVQTGTGSFHLSNFSFSQIARRIIDALVCIGAVAPFSIFGLFYLLKGNRRKIGLGLVGASGLCCFLLTFFFQGADPVPALLRTLFLVSSLLLFAALGHALWRAKQNTREVDSDASDYAGPDALLKFRILLVAWLVFSAGFLLLFVPFFAIRHVLILLPPILLLLGDTVLPRLSQRIIGGVTAATVAIGLWLGASDWQTANYARIEAPAIRATLPASTHVYFFGHWGWQWYAAHAGMQQYDLINTRLAPGDYLVAPHVIGTIPISAQYAAYLEPVRDVTVPPAPPWLCSTISRVPAANYYAGGWDPLPWAFSSQPQEIFSLFRVSSTPVASPAVQ